MKACEGEEVLRLFVAIQVHGLLILLVERRHPVLSLASVLFEVRQRLQPLALDGLPDLLAPWRDAAFEGARSHV